MIDLKRSGTGKKLVKEIIIQAENNKARKNAQHENNSKKRK